MKPIFAPKFNGLAYAAAVAGLALVAIVAVTWVPRWLPVASTTRESATGTMDPETVRIEQATESLRQAARFERTQQTDRQEGSDSILPLYSPSAITASPSESKPLDGANLNVVIVETARGRTATIDGAVVRIGERLPGGGILRAIDRTGIVIEDSAGAKHGVDLKDRFVRRDAAVLAAPSSTPPRSNNTTAEK